MIAYKFLAAGRISPFTGFQWPGPGEWVSAARDDDAAWVHGCRRGDLPYWLDEELWRMELADPARRARYQVASPRARLVARIAAWDPAVRREYARACALRARDVALPHLVPALRDALAGADDLEAVPDAVRRAGSPSHVAAYLSDAAVQALRVRPAATSYIACALASTLGGGLGAFEAERAWQARWLAGRLGLREEPAPAGG